MTSTIHMQKQTWLFVRKVSPTKRRVHNDDFVYSLLASVMLVRCYWNISIRSISAALDAEKGMKICLMSSVALIKVPLQSGMAKSTNIKCGWSHRSPPPEITTFTIDHLNTWRENRSCQYWSSNEYLRQALTEQHNIGWVCFVFLKGFGL